MGVETVGTVHVDQLLTNLAVLYRPSEVELIADMVAPYLPVVKESDLYTEFTQGDFYATDVDDLVADRDAPREVGFGHSNKTYRCQRRELAFSISDRERKNADNQLRFEATRQQGTLMRLLLKREMRVAALLRKTTNGGQLALGTTAAGDWGTAGTTTIQSDVFTGREAIRQAIGRRPNLIIIPEAVASDMQANTALNNKILYTYGSEGARPMLSEYYPCLPPVLWGMKVVIPGVLKNTAAEGATASYSDIWGENVILLYVSTGAPDIENPSVAYTFRSDPLTTGRSRDDWKNIDKFKIGQTIDERVVAPYAGYEIENCT